MWIKIPLIQNLEAGQKQLDIFYYIKIKDKKFCITKYYIQSKKKKKESMSFLLMLNSVDLILVLTLPQNMVDLLKTCWTVYKRIASTSITK